jgi:hypothetical protein
MHDSLRYVIIGSSLVLGACDHEEEFELDQGELGQPTDHQSVDEVAASPSGELRAVAGLDLDCVYVEAPIIARINPALTACKFAGFEQNFGTKWEAASLFEEGSPMLESIPYALPVHSPLREFCRYEYIGNASDPYNDYAAFIGHLKGGNAPNGVDGPSAAIDCPVIAPMTDEGLNTANGRAALHQAFMNNIDAVTAADLDGVPRYDMKLVLLDTVAEGVTPYNEHGLQLEQLIADIACPGDTATCLGWIEHVLVMPRVPEDDFATADWSGGNVGYMHEFAMGVGFAVLDWAGPNLALPLAERERLVMSAAVGADPNHPIASDPAYAPAQSAIVALQAAYCMGATVYAAAGNTRDNSCPNDETEMLAPARYESVLAPTAAQCSSWGYVQDNPGYTYLIGSPLIHAVGGVDGLDQPIANHRRDAHPRLAATASDAISSNGTVAITGTSVATAVVAGTHLLRWSLDPNRSGPRVAKDFHTTGYATGDFADAGLYINAPIRRLGVCHAVTDLLGLSCSSMAPDPANFDDYLVATEEAIAAADLADLLIEGDAGVGVEADCSEGPVFDVFIKPQPQRPACAHCGGILAAAGDTHMLNMSIAQQLWTQNLDVTSAYLHTYDAAGSATTFDLGAVVPNINNANPTNVIQVQFTVPAPASAVLEFVYSDGYTYTKQSNPIPLL